MEIKSKFSGDILFKSRHKSVKATLLAAIKIRADLRGANLRGANLGGADIDFAAWFMGCKSFGAKVDIRIAAQIAIHFCKLDCDKPEVKEAQKLLAPIANQFHRIGEVGKIEE